MVEIIDMGGRVVRDKIRQGRRAATHVALGLALVGAGVLVGQSPAAAAPNGFFIEGRQFFSIDPATGESALIGSTEVDERFSSLAFGPDGTLFAVADAKISEDVENPQIEPAELYKIDIATGAATLVGMLSENNDTGMAIIMTSLTFTEGGVALMTGVGQDVFETMFVVDIDGASGGLVPVSPLNTNTGFLTLATDTDCDGRIFGISIAVPERDEQTTTATIERGPPRRDPRGAQRRGAPAALQPAAAGRRRCSGGPSRRGGAPADAAVCVHVDRTGDGGDHRNRPDRSGVRRHHIPRPRHRPGQ